jgi:hypothetical protein
MGLNIDALNGCFTKVEPSSTVMYGTPANDPNFISDCTALVNCAYKNKCGFEVAKGKSVAECYCGAASIDDCFITPGAANGACKAEYQAAARSTALPEISIRTSDLAYPVGWAYQLLQCDGSTCGGSCVPQAGGGGTTSGGRGGSTAAGSGGSSAGSGGKAGAAGTTTGGIGGGTPSSLPGATAACTACRESKCKNYMGLGFDALNGCFTKVDPASNTTFGTPANDPNFISDCTALVKCAYDKKCGFNNTAELAQCFCGTASVDDCFATAGKADGACVPEFQKAGRSTVLSDLSLRTTDLAYPVGWAFNLVECDSRLCSDVCPPK